MNKTNIEWVRNPDGTQGYTWNAITGCLNHDNGLCKGGGFPCYAYKLANTRLKPLYLANENIVVPWGAAKTEPIYEDIRNDPFYQEKAIARTWIEKGKDPFYPRFWEDRVREEFGSCYAGAIPKGIFVCDMGDLFGIGVPEAWTRRILSHIGMSWYREHRLYLLTKQAQRLPEFSPFPENCWVGVTATTFMMFADAYYYLKQVKAKVKFLSFEPLLCWGVGASPQPYPDLSKHLIECCDWLIIGACTGTKKDMEELCKRYPKLTLMPYGNKWTAQPPIEWVSEIVEAADKVGIPVFLKDNLKPLFEQVYGQDPHSYYYHNGLRQEMPIEQ